MHIEFSLELGADDSVTDNFKTLYQTGYEFLSGQRSMVEEKISPFLLPNGSIDGSKMQANWFPQIEADFFISHSHKDNKLAIALAGWLKITFGLTAFIESCIWGYSNKLLKRIDNTYCHNINRNSYNYNKRNYSTSHVYVIFSVALTQMIDNTECLFFQNTPNSITPNATINHTESPWIYFEIAMSRLIRKKELVKYWNVSLVESQEYSSVRRTYLKLQYDLATDHLIDIDATTLEKWENYHSRNTLHNHCPTRCPNKFKALDTLYKLTT
ncbi:hypothetical protein HMPREF2955_05060 [Prevotella sp. HMSC073D09]|nr:hypothetical protein [Prevotella conceptionensis]OFQ26437.1 hypothetical protein HMPREF2955_05060 [Prevotella sp. HMSC073D09]